MIAVVSLLSSSLVAIPAAAAPIGQGFELNAADIRFIRQQIRIAEFHIANTTVATGPCGALIGLGPDQVADVTLPFGLRTVDGSCNNLQPGQASFGKADVAFPRLLPPSFRNAEPVPPGFGPTGAPTSYNDAQNSHALGFGSVIDSHPRTISNLIVDQTPNNPAAVDAGGPGAPVDPDTQTIFIKNVAPDEGLSAPFNSWFTLFGQFFDHGLDLVTKGGSGTVFITLKPDDPLYVPGGPNFMAVTRATTQPGGAREGTNTTTPFVDQNQTYTSHPSHQVFLRAYDFATGRPVPTGKLLDGAIAGNIASWSETKLQATQLGIALKDMDVHNVPLLVTDPYGHFIPGPNGFPQVLFPDNALVADADTNPDLLEGNPGSPINISGALRTGHAFLDDIAHNATPNPGESADANTTVSSAGQPQDPGTYDDELLDLHFVTGDGRGNENIGLTAVHSIFHAEHNRLAVRLNEQITTLLTPAEIADWQAVSPSTGWGYGERLFQAARFVTEMQYQHLVFEEFGRKIQPQINIFAGYDTGINPAISAEFAHVVYRFGHSMLTETVDRQLPNGSRADMDLFDAFLNPTAFNTINGQVVDASVATGSIVQAMTQQVGNEIDEFITDALRNRLVGLPLDLATVNMARARSEGIPPLNVARAGFYNRTGDPILAPYTSWADFSFNLKNQASLLNFVAAYGQHPVIVAETTIAGKRAAADRIINGTVLPGPDGFLGDNPLTVIDESLDDTPANGGAEHPIIGDDPLTPLFDESLDDTPASPGPDGVLGDDPLTFINEALDDIQPPADALDFMLSTGAWASQESGLNLVDFWVGGLAEAKAPFGGMLGSTFNYVFETQMEDLQDGDRFYYLSRTAGMNLLVQLEGNSFSELIMRNSSARGLPAEVFSRPDYSFTVAKLGSSGAISDDPATPDWDESALLSRNIPTVGTIRFGGAEHVNWNGNDLTENSGLPEVDRLFSGLGDDTIRLNSGNDWAEGGAGNDQHIGGEGNDILNDSFGDDVIKGGPGNDAIASGQGFDLNQGGTGSDFVVAGSDPTETFGGPGNDLIWAGASADTVFGDDGDDWIQGGGQADLLQGDNGAPFQNDVNAPGHDVIIGEGGNDDYDSEGGDDIMVAGDGIERNEGMLGFDWVTYKGDNFPADADFFFTGLLPPTLETNRDRFDLVEGLSGYQFDDKLRGDERDGTVVVGVEGNFVGHELDAAGIARIQGLAAILPAGASSFANGNIILGGGGDDILEGRGGNDILDGDRWLDVQLSDGVSFVDSMLSFRARVFAGTLDPGTISIVRSIKVGPTGPNGDTAVFRDVRTAYTITANPDGSYTVSHTNAGVDGVDTLWNIERAQFADGTFPLANAVNIAATGAPTLSNINPTEGAPLTASSAGIADGNGLPASFSFQWQVNNAPNGTVFTNIAGATGATFTPAQAQVNRRLRVVVSFTDLGGFAESLTSAQSGLVGDLFVGGAGGDNFTGTAGNDNASGAGGNDTLTLAAGDDIGNGGTGNDTLAGGTGNDTLDGGAGADNITGAGGNDRITGGAGNDTLNPGAGLDTLVFAPGFGNDDVTGFDFQPVGAQDLLDIRALGVTAANFASRVTIANAGGGRTLVTIRNAGGTVLGTIRLNGGQANYNSTDFILAP